MKKHKPVRIEWYDATEVETETAWVTPEEAIIASQKDQGLAVSCGYLIHKDKDHVLLAMSFINDECCTLFRIPTKWVKSMKEL